MPFLHPIFHPKATAATGKRLSDGTFRIASTKTSYPTVPKTVG